METTFREEINKGYETLANMRAINALLDVRNYITKEIGKLEYKNISELEYCEMSSKLNTLKDTEEQVNLLIKQYSVKE